MYHDLIYTNWPFTLLKYLKKVLIRQQKAYVLIMLIVRGLKCGYQNDTVGFIGLKNIAAGLTSPNS